ncbi:MAG: hypothetical protein KBT65_12375 [Sulfitobacter sp.]|nr:hypothetical protein [Sulfitobacter sp.]
MCVLSVLALGIAAHAIRPEIVP